MDCKMSINRNNSEKLDKISSWCSPFQKVFFFKKNTDFTMKKFRNMSNFRGTSQRKL